jgi:hypothetical protein
MEATTALYNFMEMVWEDPRIGPSHISLFIAILILYHKQEYQFPITVIRRELMKIAKISGIQTYHKCLKDLNRYGYIQYMPSFNPGKRSLIFL